MTVGRIRAGFHLIDASTLVIGDHELFARADVRRPVTRRRYESRAIDSFLDLHEGDLVVHVNHGIARYRGMQFVDKTAEHAEETPAPRVRRGDQALRAVAKIDLVQKYVGGGKAEPELSKLGGTTLGAAQKKRVAEAVVDLAGEHARAAGRCARPSRASPSRPTADWQARVRGRVPLSRRRPTSSRPSTRSSTTWQQPRPMDRLICGDVGYGKTELAMRAAFKAVDAGKQVAVLVPTTVLAEQHYRTLLARGWPSSRSRSRSSAGSGPQAEQTRGPRSGWPTGGVDIVIGTHRLVQQGRAVQGPGPGRSSTRSSGSASRTRSGSRRCGRRSTC